MATRANTTDTLFRKPKSRRTSTLNTICHSWARMRTRAAFPYGLFRPGLTMTLRSTRANIAPSSCLTRLRTIDIEARTFCVASLSIRCAPDWTLQAAAGAPTPVAAALCQVPPGAGEISSIRLVRFPRRPEDGPWSLAGSSNGIPSRSPGCASQPTIPFRPVGNRQACAIGPHRPGGSAGSQSQETKVRLAHRG
jgi:hypothetical protein